MFASYSESTSSEQASQVESCGVDKVVDKVNKIMEGLILFFLQDRDWNMT